MVHLRPGDGYRRLLVVESRPDASKASPTSMPSATAWRWISEHEAPVEIDVTLGTVDVGLTGAVALAHGEGAPNFDSKESRARLLQRDATHVLALPLRAPRGAIDGMFSIEALCRAAMGRGPLFAACRDAAQVLAAVAAPYLCTLPLRPVEAAAPDEHLPVIGASMAGVIEMLRVFAQQEETVLLSGPTGAGKSRLARWCHEQSSKRGQSFETLDLSTVPEDLQMAELFGWKKGAFTGALKDTVGCIGRAEGGTLFIDEIDKLSLKAQAGLLRVLEERRYRPLGEGAGDRTAEVRFVIGTNADLYAEVRSGRFREDLYYRINVLPVKVPPLAERRDEIGRWAEYMLDRRHRAGGKAGEARLSPEAERVLLAQPWPGNLRQLDNIVRRAYAFAQMDRSAPPEVLTLEARHIERALGYEAGGGPKSLLDLFQLTAAAFVAEAQRRRASGGSLDLDLVDALRGFVLGTAAHQLGSREEAFRLLGKEAIVQSRNHHKSLKREMDKVEALCNALGLTDERGRLFGGMGDGDER
ncbi:sigma-54-dependent transcriptional regulator [Sorangium sp. So ce131]|uniref:sigma-54-dependent transcriptional regulator n=1 Tax=Sorangium sp. So ce131 TaxID=3133282 RepID=UPI003F5FA012